MKIGQRLDDFWQLSPFQCYLALDAAGAIAKRARLANFLTMMQQAGVDVENEQAAE